MEDANLNQEGSWKGALIGCGGMIGGLIGCNFGLAFAFAWYRGLGNEIIDHRSDATVIGSVTVGILVALACTLLGILGAWMISMVVQAVASLWKWNHCQN